MSKVPPDPPLIEMKIEPEDESSSEGSSGSFSDSDDSEDLENSRKIQEFQEKVSFRFTNISIGSIHVVVTSTRYIVNFVTIMFSIKKS